MPTFYGPPSDGTVIPEQLETALAADLADPNSVVGHGARQGLASRYATASTQAATAPIMAKLERGVQSGAILAIGDSTGNGTNEHFYLTLLDVAARYPAYTVTYRVWDMDAEAYTAPTTVQTGTGAHTLAFYNCSAAGKSTSYVLGARWATAIAAVPEPDLVLISHGHNMGGPGYTPTGSSLFRANMLQLTEELSVQFPRTGIVLESQNPTTVSGRETWNAIKAQELQELAGQRGFGFIDAHQAFIDYADENGVTVDSLLLDTIHPTDEGSRIWADAEIEAFTHDPSSSVPPRQTSPLLQAGASLLPDPYFTTWTDDTAPPPGWTATNATIERDTANWETGGSGVRIVAGATSGGSYMRAQSEDAWGSSRRIAGRVITAAIRVFVPAGYAGNPSLIIKDNTGGSMQSRNDVSSDAQGRFVWLFTSKRMSAEAKWVSIEMHARITGAAAGSITVDRVLVTEGDLPREAVPVA